MLGIFNLCIHKPVQLICANLNDTSRRNTTDNFGKVIYEGKREKDNGQTIDVRKYIETFPANMS